MGHSTSVDELSGGNKHIKEEEPEDEGYICTTTVCGNAVTVTFVFQFPIIISQGGS